MWWPFKKKKPKVINRNEPTPIQPQNPNLAALSNIGFIGNHSESPNKHYLIAWFDGDLDLGVGGARSKGSGSYIVLENGEIILRGNSERPNDCKIANNGNFIINDWLFTQNLSGKFLTYDKNGTELVSQKFSSNLADNCISDDGLFAACNLCNSNTQDSGMLALFDLSQGKLIKRIFPEEDYGNLKQISSKEKFILFHCGDFGDFRIGFDGSFLDREKWINVKLTKGSVFDLLYIAEDKLRSNPNQETLPNVVKILETALTKGFKNYTKEKAKAYRFIGEAYELGGQYDLAIKNYETAINIDPKVGIARKLHKLKKDV